MAARWPGQPGSPERKAAYAADRARRAERAQARYPNASEAERRAIVAGHPERARSQLPPSVVRDLRTADARFGAKGAHLVTIPTKGGGERIVITYRTSKGRWRSFAVPSQISRADLERLLAAQGVPMPTETP